MDILVEPVKTMLEKACEATSNLLTEFEGKEHIVEIAEYKFEDTVTLYLKCNGDIIYKKVWQMENESDLADTRAMLFGSLITEIMGVFVIAVRQMSKNKNVTINAGQSNGKGYDFKPF